MFDWERTQISSYSPDICSKITEWLGRDSERGAQRVLRGTFCGLQLMIVSQVTLLAGIVLRFQLVQGSNRRIEEMSPEVVQKDAKNLPSAGLQFFISLWLLGLVIIERSKITEWGADAWMREGCQMKWIYIHDESVKAFLFPSFFFPSYTSYRYKTFASNVNCIFPEWEVAIIV